MQGEGGDIALGGNDFSTTNVIGVDPEKLLGLRIGVNLALSEDAVNRLFWHIEVAGKTFPALLDPGSRKLHLGSHPAKLLQAAIIPISYLVMPTGQTCRNESEADLTFEIDEMAQQMIQKAYRTDPKNFKTPDH